MISDKTTLIVMTGAGIGLGWRLIYLWYKARGRPGAGHIFGVLGGLVGGLVGLLIAAMMIATPADKIAAQSTKQPEQTAEVPSQAEAAANNTPAPDVSTSSARVDRAIDKHIAPETIVTFPESGILKLGAISGYQRSA